MSQRTKIILIIIAVILGILLLVFGFLWLVKKAPLINTNQPVNFSAPPLALVNKEEEAPPMILSEPDLGSYLLATASTFAEKFGSFSNQSNFENLGDLKVMMTSEMISWAENYIRQNQAKPGEAHYGVTTKALLPKIVDFQEGKGEATIAITTQRQETINNTLNPRIFYQDILLKLKKSGDKWLVAEAEWQ